MDSDFPLLCTYSIKKQSPVKKKSFQTMPEASFPAKVLFFQCQWCIFPSSQWCVSLWHWLWHCRRKRWAEKFTQTTFTSIIFLYLYKLDMHFFLFSRLFLNLNLSSPAKSLFDSVFINRDKSLKLAFPLVLKWSCILRILPLLNEKLLLKLE